MSERKLSFSFAQTNGCIQMSANFEIKNANYVVKRFLRSDLYDVTYGNSQI